MHKRRYKIISVLGLITIGTVLSGQACSKFSGRGASYLETSTGMVEVTSNATLKIANSEEILPSLISIAGTGAPSATTQSGYDSWKTLYSESGNANSVNSPMMLGILNLSGEVCNDLIKQELLMPMASRRVFTKVNTDATTGDSPSTLSAEVKGDFIRRLARLAWARNETPDELSSIVSALDVFKSDMTKKDISLPLLFTCSAIFAAPETHTR
jgi:hypothetical protein